jgi:hypothetical protein
MNGCHYAQQNTGFEFGKASSLPMHGSETIQFLMTFLTPWQKFSNLNVPKKIIPYKTKFSITYTSYLFYFIKI